ncbi:hypothetical protein [Paenibacillus xanthanilyticus]|uniref:Antitoxin n=1 Tax=Paenibacillus xanthanilyticus TaxID=1783531 RepID=A0ABV8KC50_9BACL
MRVNVDITQEQYAAFREFARSYNVSVSDILSSFVADLSGVRSNGSDERLFAREYFQRTDLSWMYRKGRSK